MFHTPHCPPPARRITGVVLFFAILALATEATAQGLPPLPRPDSAAPGRPPGGGDSIQPGRLPTLPGVPAVGTAPAGEPVSRQSQVLTDGGTAAGSIRHLSAASMEDRIQRLLTVLTPAAPTTSGGTRAESLDSGGEDDGSGATAPAFGIRRIRSRAEEPLARVGSPDIVLTRAHLSADVWNNVAVCTLQLDWVNTVSGLREATYYLPISPTTLFTGLELSMRSRMEDGTHEDLTQATQTYETIVRRSLDPALLEVHRSDVARLRVFPLEPGITKRVRVHWVEMLEVADGRYRFAFPTDLHEELNYRMGKFSATVRVSTGFPRKMLGEATTGSILSGKKSASVNLSPRSFARMEGVKVAFESAEPDQGFVDALTLPVGKADGYFLIARYGPAPGSSPALASPAPLARGATDVRNVSFRDGGISVDEKAGKEVFARTWRGGAQGALTLYVGRYAPDAAGAQRSGRGSRGDVPDRVRAAIEALWVGQQMEALSETLSGESAEQAAAVKELGRQHGVMTPFSALLVVEPGWDRR